MILVFKHKLNIFFDMVDLHHNYLKQNVFYYKMLMLNQIFRKIQHTS
jgi:hypothetical protein